MARTDIRQRSSVKRRGGASKKTGEVALKTGIRILVEDLRVGDRIVKSWHTRAEAHAAQGRRMTEDEVMDVLLGGEDSRYVDRSTEVKDFTECPSMWRTHVHVNKTECYDMRTYIWIVKPKEVEK